MKTRLIQLMALTLLLTGSGLAAAADSPPRIATETATVPATPKEATETRDLLAWQRVGSPLTLEG